MDSLVPAFVAALLAGLSDRPAWRAAMLADRGRGAVAIIAGMALAHALLALVAALSGRYVGLLLTPNARSLLLGLALLSAGVSALWPMRRLHMPYGRARLLGSSIALCIAERAGFVTFALAARGPSAALAGIGGAAGGIVLLAAAAALGTRGWRLVARRGVAIASGAALALIGLIVSLSALRLT